MKCVWTQKVSLLIDGELPQAEAHELRRHLDGCADCQSAHEDFLLLRRQLADYPLTLDAFARQRALRRILAASGDDAGQLENNMAAPSPRRRHRGFAGIFAMPRLGTAGLAALLLLLVGAAAGIYSLMNERRAPGEVVRHAPTPAPNANRNDTSPAATPFAPSGSTASAKQTGGGEHSLRSVQLRATPATRSGLNAVRVESARGRASKPPALPSVRSVEQMRVDAPVAEAARNEVETIGGASAGAGADDAAARGVGGEAGETAGASKTARHVEQAQLLLRSFRNARAPDAGRRASSDLAYERQRSKKLLYENIVLRREAASRGNLPVESLLDSLEPILIDIANLPDRPAPAELKEINERMRRKNLVAMLQISAVETASARTF